MVFGKHRFVITLHSWLFFTKTNGLNLRCIHAQQSQALANSICSFLIQSQVVFATTTFIGMTLEGKIGAVVGLQELSMRFDG